MQKFILLFITIFSIQSAMARSLAPNQVHFKGQVKAEITKEFGVTCMAIGCPPAPIFLKLVFRVLDTNSDIEVIDTNMERILTYEDSSEFNINGLTIQDGDHLNLEATLEVYPLTSDYAFLIKTHKINFPTAQDRIDFAADVLVSCQDQAGEQAFTIINNEGKAQIWKKNSQNELLFPVKGEVKIQKFRNGTTKINLKAEQEKIDWENMTSCWTFNKYPNLNFFFDAAGNATVSQRKSVLTDPAAFCLLPEFSIPPVIDLDCVQK